MIPPTEQITDTSSAKYLVIIEQDEDGMYVASVPALQGCHTQAKNIDKLMLRIREAIELCLEVEQESTKKSPLKFIGVQQLEFTL